MRTVTHQAAPSWVVAASAAAKLLLRGHKYGAWMHRVHVGSFVWKKEKIPKQGLLGQCTHIMKLPLAWRCVSTVQQVVPNAAVTERIVSAGILLQ